jgi:hypothetical protein
MKKAGFILLGGLLLSTLAFAGFYYVGTASCRTIMSEPQPELAWLKKEFKLSDAEYARITKLHEAYLPQCAERCKRIAEQDRRLEQILSKTQAITPEIENLLAERAKTRADCEAEMLRHFLEVSRTMPPEEGRRYLQWVEQQTCLSGQAMEQRHKAGNSNSTGDQHHM